MLFLAGRYVEALRGRQPHGEPNFTLIPMLEGDKILGHLPGRRLTEPPLYPAVRPIR